MQAFFKFFITAPTSFIEARTFPRYAIQVNIYGGKVMDMHSMAPTDNHGDVILYHHIYFILAFCYHTLPAISNIVYSTSYYYIIISGHISLSISDAIRYYLILFCSIL